MSDFLFGDEGTPSQVVDTTPEAFMGLRNPLARQLQSQLFAPQQFQGPFAAGIAPGEQQALQGVQGAVGQVGQAGPGQQMLLGAGGFNPFAGLSGLEQQGLGAIGQQAFQPNQLTGQSQNLLSQVVSGQGQNPLQQAVTQNLTQLASGQQNPYAQQLMEAAVRPIEQQFTEEALRQRGLFTGAGQQVQGMGSSPFAQASARLSGNVANAIGDTTARLGSSLFQQQQQGQLQALGLGQQQQAQQLQAAGLGDQLTSNALQRALSGFEAAGTGQERAGQAFEQQQGRQLQAGAQLGTQQLANQTAQFEAQLQNLQAQGLPRLIEQLGIQGGLAEFERQRNELLQLMTLTGNLASGQQAVLPGTPGTPGALQSFISGLGSGVGQGVGSMIASDRRVKRDIQLAGATPGGTPVYRFRYVWEDDDAPLHMGVMADEAPREAVFTDPSGLQYVDYSGVA